MAESRTLAAIRRALAGLPGSDALLSQQAGLIVTLYQAARGLLGEDEEDVASALAIGWLESKQMHKDGENTAFERGHLAVISL